jgi:hypothetical protein
VANAGQVAVKILRRLIAVVRPLREQFVDNPLKTLGSVG